MTRRARLTPLDASFLRVETPSAHMHVAWKGVFTPRPDGTDISIEELRRAIAGRLRHAERFRQRLAFPPAGLGEAVWVDDCDFAIDRHVVAMSGPGETLPRARFDSLVDLFLSRPLPRDRALWRIELAPRLEGGGVGLAMKVHHAMVDGKSAVELALLLLDLSPDAALQPQDDWEPAPAPSSRQLAVEALADAGGDSLRMMRMGARLAMSPSRSVRIADTLRRTALSVGEDVLKPAPSSYMNADIGPRRTLVSHATPIPRLLEAKRAVPGATLNDAALAVVAGGMRSLAMAAGKAPTPLKVMVPVSTRTSEQTADVGNKIAFVFVELPVDRLRPLDRLVSIQRQTARFKAEQRASGGEALLNALGVLPEPLKDRAAKLAAHPRMYNLTVSNVPGPRIPVYLLGCELQQAAPVIPLPEKHALAIGIFSYRDELTFAAYADPTALPEVRTLPDALDAAVAELHTAATTTSRGHLRVA